MVEVRSQTKAKRALVNQNLNKKYIIQYAVFTAWTKIFIVHIQNN